MENIKIRNLKMEDFEDVMNIVCQYWDKPEIIGPELLKRLKLNPEYQYVAEKEGKIVGFMTSYGIDFKEKIGWVGYFATDITHTRQGIASNLITTFENDMKEKGVSKLKVMTVAHSLFKKLGWECEEVKYHLVKEMDSYLKHSSKLKIRQGSLKDVKLIEENFGKEKAEKFLNASFQIFRDEPQRCITGFRGEEFVGAVVGRSASLLAPLNKSIVSITFFCGKDEQTGAELIDEFAKKNLRFIINKVSFLYPPENLVEKLKSFGWKEEGIQNWIMSKNI